MPGPVVLFLVLAAFMRKHAKKLVAAADELEG